MPLLWIQVRSYGQLTAASGEPFIPRPVHVPTECASPRGQAPLSYTASPVGSLQPGVIPGGQTSSGQLIGARSPSLPGPPSAGGGGDAGAGSIPV